MVFDSRFAALQKIWNDMPLDCVKARAGAGAHFAAKYVTLCAGRFV
jgi:hypothetical protein